MLNLNILVGNTQSQSFFCKNKLFESVKSIFSSGCTKILKFAKVEIFCKKAKNDFGNFLVLFSDLYPNNVFNCTQT